MAARWGTHGTRAVLAVLACSLTADIAFLALTAWWQK